ncbi:MAG TPA: ADP-ribosylglycohydrolase family protein [Anaerolineae bacterium]|nr:ADP-ribosylglycohydrolase family protein [Anaerolineae bacterium]
MKKRFIVLSVLISIIVLTSCSKQDIKTLSIEQMRDKISGGWAGKMIGVSYGAPTEFRAQGEIYEKELQWEPSFVTGALRQDDMYVQLSFMMTMDTYGINAPAEKCAESFATAGYRLWHANVQARKNYFDGIMPPASGSPEYNLHADDIDFQIEADYIGFICPGMPQTANMIASKIGHIMNYGDGVYGGMFVAALYAEAFFETDILNIIQRALLSIPSESDYAKCVKDVIALHAHNPTDWRASWEALERKWGDVDICGALQPFNIDAKLNGAYIVMGLLYGEGDFGKTMEISIRCGQDSDCNPSNAASVIGVMNGFSGIPNKWKSGIAPIADSLFIFTTHSFNSAVEKTLEYAKQLTVENGGTVTDHEMNIKVQEPVAPLLEVSFPDVLPDYRVSVFETNGWDWKGNWEVFNNNQARYSDEPGAEATFTFEGTGVAFTGDWKMDGGKADVYIDGRLDRTIDTYYWWANEEKHNSFLWHILNLKPGNHTVRMVVTGEKKPESSGSRIYLKSATVFKTGKKKNETTTLSLE